MSHHGCDIGTAVHGDGYLVPGWAALALATDPGLKLGEYRRKIRGRAPDLDAVIGGLVLAALRHRDRLAEAGRPSAPTTATVSSSPAMFTTAQVAARLDLSPRTVRRLAASGALPGAERPDALDCWVIPATALDYFRKETGR